MSKRVIRVISDPKIARLLVDSAKRQILRHLAESQLTQRKLGDLLGMADPSVYYHLKELSAAGLTEVLSRLRRDKLITKTLVEGKEAYSLTESGMKQYGEIWLLLETLFEMKEKKALYAHQGDIIGWGIETDFVDDSSKETMHLLPTIYEFEKAIFELFQKQFTKNKLAVSNTLEGKTVLAFTIDYGKLLSFLKKEKAEQEKLISSIDPLKVLPASSTKPESKMRT